MKVRVGAGTPAEFLAYMQTTQPVRWSPLSDWIVFRDGETLRLVSPDGTQNRVISQRAWETYGRSKDGAALFGIALDENRRPLLARIDVATGKETKVADLGPVPAVSEAALASLNTFPSRGFSLHSDDKSFLTSVPRVKTQIYLMRDFDRTTRFADRWLRSGN